jgi:hypothetical protein
MTLSLVAYIPMTISTDKSIKQRNGDTTTTRQSSYQINPLILHRWSPRSMTGEELDNDTVMSLFEAAGGLLPHIITNHGDSYTPKETQYIGTIFSIY